jgi:prepilin-type N-terminal cleavage/methylation domain-containing protein
MNNGPHNRGFTLIEMMLSLALGAMVVYVAAAGFRMAAQSVTLTNRMATENAILRTGVIVALDNGDFWLSHDDPFDQGGPGQALRATVTDWAAAPRGLPFTPLKDLDAKGVYRQVAGNPANPGLDEAAGGWDPKAWGAHEPRGWSWGNLNERAQYTLSAALPARKLQTFGRYHLVASLESSSQHTWQQRQLDGLNRALGYYGLFEYMPANTGLMIYEKDQSFAGATATDLAVSREWCFVPTGGASAMGNDNRAEGINFASDRLVASWGPSYIVPAPGRSAATIKAATYRWYSTGIAIDPSSNAASISGVKGLTVDGEVHKDWLADGAGKPAHWPSLAVSNLRFMRTGTFTSLHRVAWVSPLTGKAAELSFTCFGTTLRGARQQRSRDQRGWADPFSTAADLDTY